jgi:hypothetical protein
LYCTTSQTSTGLKGTRKLQFGGIVAATSQGDSDSIAAVTTGDLGGFGALAVALPAGAGSSFGNGKAVGTSNGFITSSQGQALATGTSGGNSTADTQLTLTDGGGNGFSVGNIVSVGTGSGGAGGNAVFGPSLAAAIAAATPAEAPPAPEVVVETNTGGKKGKGGKNDAAAVVAATPPAPTAPAFNFDPNGLGTGGGGSGFGLGSGVTLGSVDSEIPANGASETTNAEGSAQSNGFGFGVGSGIAVNNGGESAGGQGGGTALGVGTFAFELDDVGQAAFDNSGVTNSDGGAGAYVGFDPSVFGATAAPAATP